MALTPVTRAIAAPLNHLASGTLGHYRLSTTVALAVTQAQDGTLLSFRWGNASNVCVIQKIRLGCLQTAAATATIMPRVQVFVARSFTVSDSAGTAITLTTNSMKKRTNMGTTLVTDIRKSAAAAGVTAGTRTLDADAIMEMPTNQTITTPNGVFYERQLDFNGGDGLYPLVLAQNEGLIVRGPSTAFGAAGTADLTIELAWAELPYF